MRRQQTDLPTIMLVEDNVDDYDTAIRSFREARIDNPVQWCEGGREALDYLRREGQYALAPAVAGPGLILLDLNMPGLDGRKTLAIIKQDEALKKIPVVILTTSADEKDVEQCYALGASSYIQKPMDFAGLVETMRRVKDYWFGTALLPTTSARD
jgi:two-component system response regulator